MPVQPRTQRSPIPASPSHDGRRSRRNRTNRQVASELGSRAPIIAFRLLPRLPQAIRLERLTRSRLDHLDQPGGQPLARAADACHGGSERAAVRAVEMGGEAAELRGAALREGRGLCVRVRACVRQSVRASVRTSVRASVRVVSPSSVLAHWGVAPTRSRQRRSRRRRSRQRRSRRRRSRGSRRQMRRRARQSPRPLPRLRTPRVAQAITPRALAVTRGTGRRCGASGSARPPRLTTRRKPEAAGVGAASGVPRLEARGSRHRPRPSRGMPDLGGQQTVCKYMHAFYSSFFLPQTLQTLHSGERGTCVARRMASFNTRNNAKRTALSQERPPRSAMRQTVVLLVIALGVALLLYQRQVCARRGHAPALHQPDARSCAATAAGVHEHEQ